MYNLTETPTRENALKFLSSSSSFGNLGLFVGAGFSKAVLNDELNEIALSWGELLEKSSEKLGVDYEGIQKEGVGFPDIATKICESHCSDNKIPYKESLQKLKREICALTSWYPDKERREEYSGSLTSIGASWIITTNYDLIIESLLTGKSITLGPNEQLITPTNIVPVYHLHGVRTNPESIVISQEDYVSLFRPSEYRQVKLALTIKESTVLIVGYSLGDVNVLTALDWSRNVFKEEQSNYPHDVVQVLRKEHPKEDPYRDKNGILIIETDDLFGFFNELSEVRGGELERERKEMESLGELAEMLNDPEQSMIEKFIDEDDFRKEALTILSEFQTPLISGFVSFLNKCIDETWVRSVPNGHFEGYNQNLTIILDILVTFSVDVMPPALFETVAYGLERVGYYINIKGRRENGKSWSATKTWESRKGELSKETVEELRNYSEQHWSHQLQSLINSVAIA